MRAAAALTLLVLAGCASAPPPMPGGASEWRWEGRHRIDTWLEVPEGVTLVLLPGTVLEFPYRDADGDGYGDNGLHVKGRIVAVGRADAPVVLTSARANPEPGDWGGLFLDNSRESRFEFCTIEFARHALHTHFSSGSIILSRITDNIEGTRLGDSRFEITRSLIAGNVSKGLNFRACANVIRFNDITANGHGIFLFETDTASVIEENNIFDNEGYAFRLGDFYEGGFELRGNWWGTADPHEIRQLIYEGDDPGHRGRVKISPAAAPLATGWEGR